MQDRLTPEPTPSQWDRVIELLCDENLVILVGDSCRFIKAYVSKEGLAPISKGHSNAWRKSSVLELQTRNSILLTLLDRMEPVFFHTQKKSLILAQKEG